ncbi:MAG: DUF1549 domain-containing protein, partial [Pirellulaceae bacterium]|nr:DUF1549 domain-containing protein [Pirellulaceae bacterium]
MRRVLTIVTLGLLFGLAVPVSGAETADLTISPNPIRLQAGNRRQTVRVQDGLRDVTRLVQWESQAPDIAAVVEGRVVGGDAGTTELTATVSGKTATVVVEVASGSAYPPLHFENDIVPLFSKLGCNGGGCHGKAVGQNGFKLSVFGYDPASDHNAVVKEARGRRIFPADPRQSLLIRKATGVSPHGGGARCAADSNDAQLLEAWIDQGAPLGDDDAPTLSHIEIAPAEVIAAMNAEYQLLVTAVYSDMSRRDVTFAASYAGNAEAVAACEQNGLVRTGERPGEAAITVNYMGQVGAARFITPKPRVVAAPTPEPFNKIDSFVWSKLDKLGISASELCDDATFYRRLHLDAIGTLPAVDDTRAFLASSAADKRQRAIEQVFKRREYADYWALKWADILLVDQSTLGDRGAYEFHRWLRAQMAVNRPYDAWVRDLLMATGNSAKYGPVNLYRALRTKEDLAKSVSQAFLGIRMDCAQCHHHPFEKWSQADFFGLAGYFNGIQRTQVSAGRELVFHQGRQETRMPLTNAIVTTRPPDGPPLPTGEAGDPRTHLATWITDADNPWFARVAVNRLWKQFFGRGLVEPEDDLRSTNPATNERLLDYLADELVAHDFDLKHVMR